MNRNQNVLSKIKIIEHADFNPMEMIFNQEGKKTDNTDNTDNTANTNMEKTDKTDNTTSNETDMICPIDKIMELSQDPSTLKCDMNSQATCMLNGMRQYYCK
jgi:hypothetical protein